MTDRDQKEININKVQNITKEDQVLRDSMTDLLCQLLGHQADPVQLSLALHGLSQPEWDALLKVTGYQDLLPVFDHKLRQLGGQVNIPNVVKEHLRQANLLAGTRNMLFLHAAGMLLSALRKQGMDVIVLKGIYLVETIYPEITMRTFGDIDILVHRSELLEVISCIEGLGYQVSTYFDVNDINTDIKHIPPMEKAGAPIIEVHWTILEENEPFTIDTEGLWRRAVTASVAGVDVLALGVEDLILHLCTHLGYQHQLKIGLKGLFDIAKVLAHFQGQVDWTQLVGIARQWGVERVVWLVLKLAEDLLGTQVPQTVLNQLVPGSVPPDVISSARVQLLAGEGQTVQMTPDLAKFASTSGLGSRLNLILRRVFIPQQSLARLYNVSPRSLKIIGCYFRRIGDLLRQYGSSVRRIWSKESTIMAGVAGEETSERLSRWMCQLDS